MVLDAHAHLTRQGWKGKGHAVKEGHLSRPLAVRVKNNLGGVGKDRDEAFPFWDHVFSSVASSIIIPTASNSSASGSDGEPDDEGSTSATGALPSGSSLFRTTTGIISPYAAANSIPSSSSSSASSATPMAAAPASALNLRAMSGARREAAKRGLYAQFARGQVIKPNAEMTTVVVIGTDGQEVSSGGSRKGKEREYTPLTAGDGISTTGARLPGRAGMGKSARLAAADGAFLLSAPMMASSSASSSTAATAGICPVEPAAATGIVAREGSAKAQGKKRALVHADVDDAPAASSKRSRSAAIAAADEESASSSKSARKQARALEKAEAKTAKAAAKLAKLARKAEREGRRAAKAERRAARAGAGGETKGSSD